MKTLYKTININTKEASDKSSYYEVVEHNGKKFLIDVTAKDTYQFGFNSYCCLSVMTQDGTWAPVVDNRSINVPFENEKIYYGRVSNDEKLALIEMPVNAFKDYIKKVY